MEYAADRFAAGLERPPPTASEIKAAEVYNEEEESKDGKNAVTKVNPHQKEQYSVLLSRALVKLHIQKWVFEASPTMYEQSYLWKLFTDLYLIWFSSRLDLL